LKNTNLKVNLKKCEFGADNVSYLWYRLTLARILPGIDKLKGVQDSKPTETVNQVRQFMGLGIFFRSLIRNFAQIGWPVNKLKSKETKLKNDELPLAVQQHLTYSNKPYVQNPLWTTLE
jgi:hypothetical protein